MMVISGMGVSRMMFGSVNYLLNMCVLIYGVVSDMVVMFSVVNYRLLCVYCIVCNCSVFFVFMMSYVVFSSR